jgi:3-isopropylmalate/(R)-2-methylmalate dehydratase small subunit
MKPLTEHTGRAMPLRRGDVDTDQIIPAEFCKRLTKVGYADALFAAWRTDPAFILNDPAYADASILIGAHNFGTGSSREHAVWALRDWGFRVVVATSFGDIFRRNAFKNGLLAVEAPEPLVTELAGRVEADPGFEITVDLVACELRAGDRSASFAVDPRARRLLLDGLDDIAVTLTKADTVTAYEKTRLRWLPRTRRTPPAPAAVRTPGGPS